MAKTIKFNLICDGKPVRTIEDLQNNFSIEDVLNYYNNKLLHRWLQVRGYEKELAAVNEIKSAQSLEIIRDLIAIFAIEEDTDKIKESIYILNYLEESRDLYAEFARNESQTYASIGKYLDRYQELSCSLVPGVNSVRRGIFGTVTGLFKTANNEDDSVDVARIKATITEIDSNYQRIFELDHRNMFYKIVNSSKPIAIFCLLMNENIRKYYLPQVIEKEDGTKIKDTENNVDKRAMYSKLCQLTSEEKLMEVLGNNLKIFAGVTDGYWKDLEPKGKKYMILRMESGDYVRASGQSGGDLGYTDVLNQFVLLDGIDYKSNNASHRLLYMEV